MFEPVDVSQIMEAVQSVFDSEDSLNQDSISIFELTQIYQEICANKVMLKKDIESKINAKLKTINDNYYATLHDFDYEENKVAVSAFRLPKPKETKFYFQKVNDSLELCDIEGASKPDLTNILLLIGPEIEKWYEYCLPLKDIENQICSAVKSSNSIFLVTISYSCVGVYYNKSPITSDFRMLIFCDIVHCKCKFSEVKQLVKDREKELMKRICVRISECPQWMQEKLYEIRKQQVQQIQNECIAKEQEEKRREEEERRIREKVEKKLAKKQKRREFWKNIFPFLK